MLWSMWWSLFFDRSRGQRRCPRCWHLLYAATGTPCPECGFIAASERQLFSTRRRWPLATLSLCALIAGTLWLRAALASDGWWTLLPSRPLITMLPWLPPNGDANDVRSELRMRLLQKQISTENCLRMLLLIRDGDTQSPPGSEAWRTRYLPWLESLQNRWSHASPEDAALRNAAAQLPPIVTLTLPESWWSDQPLVAMSRVEDWWPEGIQVRMRLRSIEGMPLTSEAMQALHSCQWIRTERRSFGGGFAIDFGLLPEGQYNGALRMSWESRDTLQAPAQTASGEILVPIAIQVHGKAPTLSPIDNAAITLQVTEAFAPGLLRRETNPPQFAFSYRPYATQADALANIAFGFIVQACEDGVPRRTLRVWWRGGSGQSFTGWEPPIEDLQRLRGAEVSPQWTLRIRGDQAIALRAADQSNTTSQTTRPATQFWSGYIEMPLPVELLPASQLGRSWRLEHIAPTPPR